MIVTGLLKHYNSDQAIFMILLLYMLFPALESNLCELFIFPFMSPNEEFKFESQCVHFISLSAIVT